MPSSPNKDAVAFGSLLKALRTRAFKSLREFSNKTGHDAVLVNQWEHGMARPADQDKIHFLAKSLGLKEDSKDYTEFLAVAERARKNFSPVEISEEALRLKMPVAFRGLRIDEDPDEIIEASRNIAKQAYQPSND